MWKYQDVLNQDLAILIVIGFGLLALILKIFKREDSAAFSIFVFKFLLPASVIQGLGLKTDLYDGDIWRFVGAWLVMRAIMLAACCGVSGLLLGDSLGEVTANWMSTTWISTVILGTPILKALLGPSYANLGVVAGISSWIFQLPLMLIFFEVHTWRQRHMYATLPQTSQQGSESGHTDTAPAPAPARAQVGQNEKGAERSDSARAELPKVSAGGNGAELVSQPAMAIPTHVPWREQLRYFRMSRAQLRSIGLRMVRNHVLWGCLIGIILNLSKIGPKWLNPGNPPAQPNCTYAVGAGFIAVVLDYFARCTEPVALFSTGMWMHQKNPLCIGPIKAIIYMIIKLVLVPMLMVGCAFMVGLEGALGRAAVLLATLPVSSATFALCKSYSVGENAAVSNVVLGNLLILPTTIAWLSIMDSIDLFNTGPVKAGPNPCNAPVKPKGL